MSLLGEGHDVVGVDVAAPTVDDLWAEVVGQPDAVTALRAAAANPVHAYLLVGPEGSGKRAAARAFAGELLSGGADAAGQARTAHLVADDNHPCVTIVERDGASITADQAREVVRRSAMAPPEGRLQVFVLDEFHLVRDAAPILLKSIEEPPPTTVFVVLAEDVPEELVTIASRCVNVALSAVPHAAIVESLLAEGAEPAVAGAAALACGGSLRRARLLVGDPDLVARRDAWHSVPGRLDGTGATVCRLADELLEGIDSVIAPLTARQEAELEQFDAVSEQMGIPRKGDRSRLEARHKREARRVRIDELRGGMATMVAPYRDDVAAGGDPVAFATAAGAVQTMADSLRFNPNEALALRALLLKLPVRP